VNYALTKLLAYGTIKTSVTFYTANKIQIDIKASRLIIKVSNRSHIINLIIKVMKKKDEKKYENFIGIDISKETIDVSVFAEEQEKILHKQFGNDQDGFSNMDKWLKKQGGFNYPSTLACMEHTGIYTRLLQKHLLSSGSNVWLESSLQIKRSLGLNRGKNDKIDSRRIAEYACRFSDKADLKGCYSKNLQKLKDLLASRERLNKSIKSILVAIKELKKVDKEQGMEIDVLNLAAIRGIRQSIKEVEKRIEEVIAADPQLKEMSQLATSIPGVGKILTLKLIVYTHAFTRFESVRQLACYCGVAPFEHRSGTSIYGRTGVSKFANNDLKWTLHMAALSSIKNNPELKKYYERKVKEGKSKMSAINAVRNKLLNRIVAVLKRKTPYVKLPLAA
jgi:transposase